MHYTIVRLDHRDPAYGYVVGQCRTLAAGLKRFRPYAGNDYLLMSTNGFIGKGSTVGILDANIVAK